MEINWKFCLIVSVVTALLVFFGAYCQYNGIGSFVLPSILSFACYILVFIGAIWYLRKSKGGFITFSNALISTFIITVLSTILSTGMIYSYGATISESKKNRVLDKIVEEALYDDYFSDKDELQTEDQLRTQYQMMFEFNSGAMMSMVGGMLFIGVIGLIISLIMKRDPPDDFNQIAA